jgi:lipoprotein-anchoring transpeptidase ErfK/SrfK
MITLLRQRLSLAVAITVALVGVLAVAAYAYDSARDDLVADGVSVAGVDLGGLRESAARSRLHGVLVRRLERPVRVAVAGRRFRLTARAASLAVDVNGTVDAAIDRGRSGGLPGRLWRGLTGSDVNAAVEPRLSYSAVAVHRFVRRVKRSVDRPVRNADVKFATAALPAIPSQTGLKLSSGRLLRLVERAILETGSGRRVRASVKVTKPKVTTGDLAKKYPEVITIDRANFRLRFFRRLRLSKAYRIAVGRAGLETPAGLYHIQDKQVNPSWHVPDSAWAGDLAGKVIPPGPEDPIKSRWMGIYSGAGIHGTDQLGSLGTAASHGCIRMAIPDVEELYDKVPLQTPVFIQ